MVILNILLRATLNAVGRKTSERHDCNPEPQVSEADVDDVKSNHLNLPHCHSVSRLRDAHPNHR